jgi:hypothetical protein
VRPVAKELICNRKRPICKDPTVEINFIRLVFLAVVYGSIHRSYGYYKGIIENVKCYCCNIRNEIYEMC